MPSPLINETRTFANISATPASFTLRGGLYALTAKATWGGGSVALQRLSGDGATYIGVLTALTADGSVSGSLPPGTYRLAITTATAVYADVTQIVGGV